MESKKNIEDENQIENVENINEAENDAEAENVEVDTNSEPKCVFVSGIPYDTLQEDIKLIFEKAGIIRQIKMPKYQDSELNNTHIGTRYISVSVAKGENKERRERKADTTEVPIKCSTVFIRNLPYELTEDELGDKFRPCGEIRNIRFVYHPSQGHFKGFGYIEFADRDSVIKALKLNDKPFKGRNMIVDFENEGPKMGYKMRSEKPSKYNKDRDFLKKRRRDFEPTEK